MIEVLKPQSAQKWLWRAQFLTVVFAVAHLIFSQRIAWFRVPLVWIGAAAICGLIICIFLAVAVQRGRFWVAWGVPSLILSWGLVALVRGYWLRNPAEAFFGLAMLAVAWIYRTRFNALYAEPYFSPPMRWFEGQPRSLPGAKGWIRSGDMKAELKVSRMGETGAFVLAQAVMDQERLKKHILLAQTPCELQLGFRGREAQVKVVPVISLDGGRGIGVRVVESTPEMQTQWQKLVADVQEVFHDENHGSI